MFKKSLNKQVFGMNLPGGQNDRTPRESIFKLVKRPQRPYTSKNCFGNFLYNPYIIQGSKGQLGAQVIQESNSIEAIV